MFSCINKTLPEYKELKRLSGMSDDLLSGAIYNYQQSNKTDQLPPIEYLVDNTSDILGKDLGVEISESGYFNTQKELSIAQLNSVYRASIVEKQLGKDRNYYKIKDKATIRTLQPDTYDIKSSNQDYPPMPKKHVLRKYIRNLESRFGVIAEEVSPEEFMEIFHKDAKGGIKDGTIYINAKYSDDSVRIHEYMHLFLSPIKITNPILYEKFASIALSLQEANSIAQQYSNLTQMDLAEEVFAETVGLYMMGKLSQESEAILQESGISTLIYELGYMLDSTLDTDASIAKTDLYSKPWVTLEDVFLSHNSQDMPDMYSYLEQGKVSRAIANAKSELMKTNQLEEICR